MSRYNNSVVTKEDFKRERDRRDKELLEKISRSKSINKRWLAYKLGFDSDYQPNPALGQNE